MTKRTLRQVAVAVMLLVAFLFQGTWALAGTTGSLSGTVTDESGAPISGVAIKAISASESASSTTDASGHFTFISLAPDTYTVSIEKAGYNPVSYAGVTVFADQQLTLSFKLSKALKEITKVSARAAGNLVKPGTTSDVYSVNEATQTAQSASAGGYNLNSAYSAVYNTPGVQGSIGNAGFGQVFYIRGSSYSQVGYEFDGVPVNRAFDNYNANSMSNLGQQELQVYTGGSPAGASSATLGGFINQVIKTGTYPGTGSALLGVGAPGFYHSGKLETGGATPNRMFSYYVGLSGYDQAYNFQNNSDFGSLDPTGNNAYGITGASNFLNPAGFNLNYGNGPWAACNANGTAPVGATSVAGVPQCVSYLGATTGLNQGGPFMLQDRESVINLHFGIPHHKDGGRDDIQVLFDNYAVNQDYQNNYAFLGGESTLNSFLAGTAAAISADGLGTPGAGPYANTCEVATYFGAGCATTGMSNIPYADSHIFAPGTKFGQLAGTATVVPYYFPSSPTNRALYSGIPMDATDSVNNVGSIFKVQYQKNLGSRAYIRAFGYSFYSDWMQNAPYGAAMTVANLGASPSNCCVSNDYELATHTRGAELQFADQINDKNLLNFTGNFTTASADRWNNYTSYQSSGIYGAAEGTTTATVFSSTVNGIPTCYSFDNHASSGTTAGQQVSCFSSYAQGNFSSPLGTYNNANPTPSFYTTDNPCTQNAALTGSAACANGARTIVATPGDMGYRNVVRPAFTSLALTDEFRPSDRWDINGGVRFEQYQYNLENTDTTQNQFWFGAAANTYCYWSNTGQAVLNAVTPTSPVASPQNLPNTVAGQNASTCYVPGTLTPKTDPVMGTALHPNGLNGNKLYSANGPSVLSKQLWSPRIGFTYTLNPDTVLRASYGRYTQPTETAYEQYNGPSGVFVAKSDFSHFWGIGFTDPVHDNPVQVSNNYDFSFEKHIKGTDMTFKLSPYYRYTVNQLISVSLGGNFSSGINAATQKSTGLEVAIQKGDPSRNGFAGQLAYTYSRAVQKYAPVGGQNAIQVINDYISSFNNLTQAGGGSPCYNPGAKDANGNSTGVACGANPAGSGYIVNPYYGYTLQGALDPNAYYEAYPNNPPTAVGANDYTQTSPNQFTGFLNYKRNKFSMTLNGVLQEGVKFGSPLDFLGYDPRTCSANQSAIVGTDTPANADYQSCLSSVSTLSGNLAVPNPTTGAFTGMGQYREPWQFNLGAQMSYQFTPRVKGTVVLANVVNRCFGGSKPAGNPWSPGSIDCGWATNGAYISDFYYGSSPTQAANGTAGYPSWLNQPYGPSISGLPFQAYFNLSIKL